MHSYRVIQARIVLVIIRACTKANPMDPWIPWQLHRSPQQDREEFQSPQLCLKGPRLILVQSLHNSHIFKPNSNQDFLLQKLQPLVLLLPQVLALKTLASKPQINIIALCSLILLLVAINTPPRQDLFLSPLEQIVCFRTLKLRNTHSQLSLWCSPCKPYKSCHHQNPHLSPPSLNAATRSNTVERVA